MILRKDFYQFLRITESNTDFGKVIFYNRKQYCFALYKYADESDILYLANVEVFEKFRGKGFGNNLLNEAKSESLRIGAKSLYLKCNPKLWVYDWYLRNGFKHLQYDKDNVFVWMRFDF